MIRVGNAILNEDAIAAIIPVDDNYIYAPQETATRLLVALSSGDDVYVNATMAEAVQALENVGVLEPERYEPQVAITPREIEIFRSLYRANFRFVAKDKDGKVFAYTARPSKGARTWVNDDDESSVHRIGTQLDCVSFDDEDPLDLEGIFAEAAPC